MRRLEALSGREFGRDEGEFGGVGLLGDGTASGWTLQLSMARMRIDLESGAAVAASESRALVVWDPRFSLEEAAQEQSVYCRELQLTASHGADSQGRRGLCEQPWGLRRDSFTSFQPVDLPCVPDAVQPATKPLVNQLVRESGRHLVSLVQAMPSCSTTPGDVPCLDERYGLVSDFTHLQRRLPQSAPAVPSKQTQESKLARLRRVVDVPVTLREPKRDFLGEQSATIFKAVLRKNLDTMFVADETVPNLLEGELVMAALHHVQTESGIGGTSASLLRQVILTPRLLAEDEVKMNAAPGRITDESDRLLKSLKLSPVSLTRATMAIPSFWRQLSVLSCLPDYSNEERHVGSAIEVADTPPVEPSGVVLVADIGEDAMIVAEAAYAGQDTPERASHAAGPHANSTASRPALKLKDVPDSELVGTDYLLSDMFMRCDWAVDSSEVHEKPTVTVQQPEDRNPGETLADSLNKLARPALWELARKKLLMIRNVSMQEALATADLGKLQATICQLLGKINNIRLNPEVATHEEIVEACTSFREALWVHTLRLILLCEQSNKGRPPATSKVMTALLFSAKYKQALGARYWKQLQALYDSLTGSLSDASCLVGVSNVEDERKLDSDNIAASKEVRTVVIPAAERLPVRLLCSMELLNQDDLLDELQSDYDVTFVERELPAPIGMVVDERNGISLLHRDVFEDNQRMKSLILQLAHQQIQYERLWLILHVADGMLGEGAQEELQVFYSALVNFRTNVTLLTSQSISETCTLVRFVIDACADTAVSVHRVLPTVWYDRPFLLEDESQHERFLVSTGVLNYFSAQSLLHKISLDDLFSRSIEELRSLVLGAITDSQLDLLWSMVHSNHGINFQRRT